MIAFIGKDVGASAVPPVCKETARWIRDARANAERTAARGFVGAVEQVEASIATKLAKTRAV